MRFNEVFETYDSIFDLKHQLSLACCKDDIKVIRRYRFLLTRQQKEYNEAINDLGNVRIVDIKWWV